MPLSNPTPPIAALAASAIAALLVWAAVGAWLIAWKRPEDRRIAGWMGAAAMAAAAYAALEVAQYLGAELWAMEARASLGLIRVRGMALVLLLFAVSEIADAGSKERFPLPRTGRGALAIGLAGLVGLTPWVVGPLRTVRLSWAGEVMVPQPTLAFVAWGIALFTGSAYVWIWLFGGLAARHRRAMGIGAVALHAAAAVDLMTSIGLVAPVAYLTSYGFLAVAGSLSWLLLTGYLDGQRELAERRTGPTIEPKHKNKPSNTRAPEQTKPAAETSFVASDPERSASVGTLASGIAHEINNPLSYLMGSLDQSRFLLASHSPDLDELRASIAEAREGAKRVRDIVAEVRKLANEPAGRDLPLQLRPMVDEVTKSLARDLANNVRLEVRVDESIVVRANDGRLKLVISHLLRNAIQSTRPGEPNRIELAAHEVGESSVVVTIRDEGRGMSEDTQRRVFDPFFSTRRGGTGLGLALCREICLQMGSALHIDSELGRGTTVSLRLVRSDEPSATRTLSAPSEIERSLRCLVVDDEPAVCRLMQRLLQNRFQVEATTSSEAALDQIRAGARFDVIVCDVSMPNLSGPELYGALEAIAPDQAAGMVFVTGGIVEEGDAAFFERTGHVFLHKPFTNDELVAEVTRAANRSATSGPKAKSLVG